MCVPAIGRRPSMDETPLLDTERLRDLLHAVADSRAPVCAVNIARARRAGGRQRAVRRLHLPWVAPIAAAAAVTVIAAVAVPLAGNEKPTPPARAVGQPVLMPVPSDFTAQSPIVTFGWLPPGFDDNGVAYLFSGGPSGPELDLQAQAPDGRMLILRLFAAGACQIGGPIRFPPPAWPVRKSVYVRYPLSHSCPAVQGAVPLVRQVARVNGGLAYQEPSGGLFWEYGRNAWASLQPMINLGSIMRRRMAGHHPRLDSALRGWLNLPPVARQSSASRRLLRQVASRLRVSTAPAHPLYGFTLTGMPASWGTGFPSGMAMLDGRLAADNFGTTGPAADPNELYISVWPAPRQTPGSLSQQCKFVAGQSSYITVDGVRAVLRNMIPVGKHTQYLCIPDVDGLSVGIGMDVWSEGSDSKPLPGWPSQGVLAMFRHMHLLGPDVANWTTDPLR
jgi:hypothetical protein